MPLIGEPGGSGGAAWELCSSHSFFYKPKATLKKKLKLFLFLERWFSTRRMSHMHTSYMIHTHTSKDRCVRKGWEKMDENNTVTLSGDLTGGFQEWTFQGASGVINSVKSCEAHPGPAPRQYRPSGWRRVREAPAGPRRGWAAGGCDSVLSPLTSGSAAGKFWIDAQVVATSRPPVNHSGHAGETRFLLGSDLGSWRGPASPPTPQLPESPT